MCTTLANLLIWIVWIDSLELELPWCHLVSGLQHCLQHLSAHRHNPHLDRSPPGLHITRMWKRVGNGTMVMAIPPWPCITMMAEQG